MAEEFIVVDTVDTSEEVYDVSGGFRLPDFMYEEIKDVVSKLVKKYNVQNIPVNVFALAKKLGIRLVKFSDLTEYEMQCLAKFGATEDTAGFYALAEAMADFFAKYLIAPPMLVDKIRPIDYMEIKEVFLLTKTCAWNSFDYYQTWKRHHFRVGRYEEYENRILDFCTLRVPEPYKKVR